MGVSPWWSTWRAAGVWLAFLALLLAGWGVLFAMSIEFAARTPVSLLGPGMGLLSPLFPDETGLGALGLSLEAICLSGPSAGDVTLPALFAMWALMALAMMAPTAAPLLKTYADLAAGNPQRIPLAGWWSLLTGFCLVWVGFAVIAALAHAKAAQADLMTAGGLLGSDWLAAALLALAGLYQFSALKAACLSRCRSPMTFFLTNWRGGMAGALHMGLHQGLACLGCCWALMALAFVGGTMNLVWMGVGMVLMTVEKLAGIGRYVTAPLGGALIAAATLVAWQAASI